MTADLIFAAVREYERLDTALAAWDEETTAGLKKALEAKREAASAGAIEWEDRILEMRPATKEGALALLEFVAQRIAVEFLEDAENCTYSKAIRAAAEVLAQS